MSIVVDLLKIIGLVILVIALVPLALAAAGYVGYFFGILLSWMAGGMLADTFGIDRKLIPNIIAWLFVAGVILRPAAGRSE